MKTKHVLSSNTAGQHRIVYQDWGREDNPNVLICVHGLTRNSHDFDYLAENLSQRYRVIAPDIVGRGNSDWLPDPSLYTIEQYVKDMAILIKHLGVSSVDWIGTSLGGIIGMTMAALPQSPVRRLILNDIGACVKKDAIAFLATSLAQTPQFSSLDELRAFLRQSYAHTGALKEEHWEHMSRYDHRLNEDGTYARNYDPQLVQSMAPGHSNDIDLWQQWDAIRCPTLILHGAQSLILTAALCDEMLARNPHASVITLPGVGHTPSLMVPEHIDIVNEWLLKH